MPRQHEYAHHGRRLRVVSRLKRGWQVTTGQESMRASVGDVPPPELRGRSRLSRHRNTASSRPTLVFQHVNR